MTNPITYVNSRWLKYWEALVPCLSPSFGVVLGGVFACLLVFLWRALVLVVVAAMLCCLTVLAHCGCSNPILACEGALWGSCQRRYPRGQ
jgi:hypothetical protein